MKLDLQFLAGSFGYSVRDPSHVSVWGKLICSQEQLTSNFREWTESLNLNQLAEIIGEMSCEEEPSTCCITFEGLLSNRPLRCQALGSNGLIWACAIGSIGNRDVAMEMWGAEFPKLLRVQNS